MWKLWAVRDDSASFRILLFEGEGANYLELKYESGGERMVTLLSCILRQLLTENSYGRNINDIVNTFIGDLKLEMSESLLMGSREAKRLLKGILRHIQQGNDEELLQSLTILVQMSVNDEVHSLLTDFILPSALRITAVLSQKETSLKCTKVPETDDKEPCEGNLMLKYSQLLLRLANSAVCVDEMLRHSAVVSLILSNISNGSLQTLLCRRLMSCAFEVITKIRPREIRTIGEFRSLITLTNIGVYTDDYIRANVQSSIDFLRLNRNEFGDS